MVLMNSKTILIRKGFTLIELLVVITIIGILAGITFTGANFLFSAKDEKKASSEVEALKLALKQYQAENGDYPSTDLLETTAEVGKNELLLLALLGIQDGSGVKLKPDEVSRSFLPSDTFSFGFPENDSEYKLATMMGVETTLIFVDDEGREISDTVAIIDPWGNPYVYEYPRRDGHTGFLLYSKGPDGQASIFADELTSTPNKEPKDQDNIPATEPGKW